MERVKAVPDMLSTLQHSTHLVKTWGQSLLPNGRTLAETLTLEGIPFWDAFAVDLARLHVPAALASTDQSPGILGEIRPYLSRAKHQTQNFIRHRRSTDGCSGWPSERTFLFLGFSGYIYRDVLQPVAEQLAEHDNICAVSLSDRPWTSTTAYAKGGTFQTIWQHWDREVGQQASNLQRALGTTEMELRAANALARIICDGERCLWKQLKRVFDWFFRVYVPLLIPQAVMARHILENHHPALVISPDVADPRTRVYTLLCRQMAIPSMEVQFGPLGAEGIEWQFLTADRVAAWGETSKEALLAHGVPSERIVITGSPRHDHLVNVPEAEVRAKRAQLGVLEGSAMVVLASAYQLKSYDDYSNPELLRSLKQAVFAAVDQTPGICLVVKPHPLEDVSETRMLAGECRNIMFVERQSDIRELTRVCDAFISFGSTATADALIAHKIVICPVFPGWIWSDLFKNSGAVLVPHSADELAWNLQMVVNGSRAKVLADLEPARQRFLRQWVYQADGRAVARIEALALHLANLE